MQNTGMQGSTPMDATRHGDGTGTHTGEGLSRLSDTAQQTVERFTHAASEAAKRLSTRGGELLQSPSAEKARLYMREHPLAAIGIAVGIGLVLSRLLSRR